MFDRAKPSRTDVVTVGEEKLARCLRDAVHAVDEPELTEKNQQTKKLVEAKFSEDCKRS